MLVLGWVGKRLGGFGICANRTWYRATIGSLDVVVSFRDTRLPDGLSREEVVAMKAILVDQEAK